MNNEEKYPVKVYFDDLCEEYKGYNYMVSFGKLLFKNNFKMATSFDENGYAEVTTFSGETKRIDKKGNFC